MQREAHALTAGLRDPRKPTFCAACLLCFQDRLQSDVRKANMRALRTEHHDFWTSVMRFVTAKRTPASRATLQRVLLSKMHSCASPFRTRDAHSKAERTLTTHELLQDSVSIFLDFVHYCLEDSSRRLVSTQRFSSRGLWPTSASDILPHGAEQSFAGLLDWFTIYSDSNVFSVVEDVFLICRPELQEYVMQEPNRRLIIEATCGHIYFALEQLRKQHIPPRVEDKTKYTPDVKIYALARLLQSIVYGGRDKPDDRDKPDAGRWFFRGFEATFVAAVEAAFPLLPDDENKNEKARLADVATIAYDSCGTPFAQRLPAIQQQARDIHGMLGNSFTVFRRMLAGKRDAHTCGAPGCDQRERDLGRRLQRCAACGVLQYCSKECQKRHWKADEASHKAVCARIKALAPVLDDDDAFARTTRAQGLKIEDMAFIYDNVAGEDFNTRGMSPQERVDRTFVHSTFAF